VPQIWPLAEIVHFKYAHTYLLTYLFDTGSRLRPLSYLRYLLTQMSLCTNVGRDVHETFWAETETRPETYVSETKTFKILSETEMRRCSFRDLEAPETLESLGSFYNVSPRRFPWRTCMVKHIDNEKNIRIN